MTRENAQAVVDEVFSLYEAYGQSDYIGEPVSQLEHMVQAAQAAEAEGYGDEIVLAAFFHDIGHLAEFILPTQQMDGVGVVDHEKIGAQFLRERGFSKMICDLVQNHVQAKRYLTHRFPHYLGKLSSASKITLSHQGGVMDEDEAVQFERNSLHSLYIKMREWDDKAKEQNRPLPLLERYKAMAIQHLTAERSSTAPPSFEFE